MAKVEKTTIARTGPDKLQCPSLLSKIKAIFADPRNALLAKKLSKRFRDFPARQEEETNELILWREVVYDGTLNGHVKAEMLLSVAWSITPDGVQGKINFEFQPNGAVLGAQAFQHEIVTEIGQVYFPLNKRLSTNDIKIVLSDPDSYQDAAEQILALVFSSNPNLAVVDAITSFVKGSLVAVVSPVLPIAGDLTEKVMPNLNPVGTNIHYSKIINAESPEESPFRADYQNSQSYDETQRKWVWSPDFKFLKFSHKPVNSENRFVLDSRQGTKKLLAP